MTRSADSQEWCATCAARGATGGELLGCGECGAARWEWVGTIGRLFVTLGWRERPEWRYPRFDSARDS